MEKIAIVGGGPVGNYCAELLSGIADVEVFEEHKIVGEPVQCTGIVTKDFFDIVKNKGFVVNKLK
ncbi:geranylgeranyl reductase, partial [Nanoarchaeota archaeon]